MNFEVNWYILTGIFCLTGVVLNILNIIVFLNAKMKDISFRYMLVISLSDVVYLASNAYVFVTFCDECSINKSYLTQIYILYFHEYVSRSMAIFNILVEIALSVQRYLILINKTNSILNNNHYKMVVLGLLFFSFLFYLPLTFFKSINSINTNNSNETFDQQFKLEYNQIGESTAGKLTLVIISIIRLVLGSVVLTIINIISVYTLKKLIKFKFMKYEPHEFTTSNEAQYEKKSKAKLRSAKNMNLMVVFSTSFFIVGNTPHLIIYSLKLILTSTSQLNLMYRISLIVIYFAHNFNIIIYFTFNKLFRSILIQYLKKVTFLK